jgi:hypothetical protein
MTVETDHDADADFRLIVAGGGRPWATYDVTVTAVDGDESSTARADDTAVHVS